MLVENCEAVLCLGKNEGRRSAKHPGETCGAVAAFETRGHACCWLHYQADTKGPRAGKVNFATTRNAT